MSMSQEEIESLMNGLDFAEEETPAEAPTETPVENNDSNENMSEDDINELIAQTEDISSNTSNDEEQSPVADEVSVDELLNSIEDANNEETTDNNENLDDILNEVEEVNTQEDIKEETIDEIATDSAEIEEVNQQVTEENIEEVPAEDNIDDILASIDGIQETTSENSEATEMAIDEIVENKNIEENNSASNDIDQKINSGVFPLPVDTDTKVVNQLSQVASDSEEKATKIFDVLSNILDYNNEIQNDVQQLGSFNEKQVAMLASLNQKFPNIEAFSSNLEEAKKVGDFISHINDKLNNGNMEIFQAMELMQYHDINRQKIERVMSVIRKLSIYLNNLFEEDEGTRAEVAVAKHIHGDSGTNDLVEDDDLEALIAEFNN